MDGKARWMDLVHQYGGQYLAIGSNEENEGGRKEKKCSLVNIVGLSTYGGIGTQKILNIFCRNQLSVTDGRKQLV